MRSFALIAALVSTPAFAAPPPLCALPRPAPMPVAGQASASLPPTSAAPHGGPITAAPARHQSTTRIPMTLTGSPFVRHIAAAGAIIIDLGISHGLHSVAARSGDQFMLFQLAPDGQAAVSGAMTEISLKQLSTIAAGNITDLGEAHGLRGMFVRSGPQFQVFYATPDGERVIPGVMWDSSGKDLTRSQVAHIPGAVPTVTVGSVSATSGPGTSVQHVNALPLVQQAFSGTIGPASAPHLWMLIDPQCIYSIRAFQMLQPFTASGRLQLIVIPLSVLDYEDHGQSTRSALALLSKSSNRLVQAWQAGDVNNPPVPQAAERLRANGAIAQAIGLRGTPTFIWREKDGTEGRLDGIPTDVAALVASIGS